MGLQDGRSRSTCCLRTAGIKNTLEVLSYRKERGLQAHKLCSLGYR